MNEKLRQRLLQVFQAEHADHVSVIRQLLDQVSQGALNEPALNEAFRRAHSLKGAARAVDLHEIEKLAHHLETLLARVQKGEIQLEAPQLKLIHQVLDLTEDLVQAEQTQQARPDQIPVLHALETMLGLEKSPLPVASPEPADSTITTSTGQGLISPGLLSEHLRISVSRFEDLLETSDRLQVECQRQEQMKLLCRKLVQQVVEMETLCRQHWPELRKTALAAGLTQQLEGLATLSRSAQLLQRQSSWKLDQEVSSLQHSIRQLGMLPTRELFQSFPKMIRELAQEQGKEVESHFSGLEIEADRAVLQAIKDPIMHILRNAVAHGIEDPETRQAQGKPREGQIHCELETRGHQLLIRIRDDGRGLDQTRIRNRLEQSGSDPVSVSDWQALIFQPGFSTAAGVTQLHGRGMGLSVVAEAMTRLQGEYRIVSSDQPGFILELEVPLHIATCHVLQIVAGQQIFAMPTAPIDALVRIQPHAVEVLEGRPVLFLDQSPVPFYSLSQLLFRQAYNPTGVIPVMILKMAQKAIALAVDGFLSDHESLLKPLSGPAQNLPLYLGAILSTQGTPIPVLDPHVLIQSCQGLPASELPVFSRADTAPRPTILVVDDSITTRTLEKSILETQGFRVQVAVNGLEALDKLRQAAFDLVITDVQMPEMNGLELLEAMKRDPALAGIPVIMVTSMQEEQDRKKGLRLGADAYLVKQKFEQQELLDVIQQIL